MPIVNGFVNVYKSGWFHRKNKPGTIDRHGGDIYPSKAEALASIEPKTHYITTLPVSWWEPEPLMPNPVGAVPIPLKETRRGSKPTKE